MTWLLDTSTEAELTLALGNELEDLQWALEEANIRIESLEQQIMQAEEQMALDAIKRGFSDVA